ncbi:MAG: PH domain-containing protein [Candidatus Omnitrophica bacterium]|nr:PH domain-containing protein [Candidatus Omnitrophota bacterium]
MKKCPFCAEEIQDEAIKCKHCGSSLEGSAKEIHKEFHYITPKILSLGTLLPEEKLYFEVRPFMGSFFGATSLFTIISLFWTPFWVITVITFFINRSQWKNTIYAITNKRIITQRGMIGKTYKECPLSKVQNIEVNVLWYNTKIGNILFDTAGGPVKELTWIDIKNPKDVHLKISDILHK